MDVDPVASSALCSQMRSRTSGWKISAPPPGRLPKPASTSSARISPHGLFGQVLEPVDFDRRPALQVQPRIGLVQDADDVQVPVVLHLMVQAADDVHLGAAIVDRFAPAARICSSLMAYPLGSRRSERNAQNVQR